MVEKYINYLFPTWGIRFISVVDNADTEIKGNKKSRQINGLINEWYLEDMSDNIKAVLTNRRQNGFFIGAFAPYGYKKDPNIKGHLIIDEEVACVIRRIFALYIEGHGRSAIAKILNEDGISTSTEYKISKGERYRLNQTSCHKPLWRYYAISNILTNEVYIGNLVQNKAHSISYKSKIIKPTHKSEWIKAEKTHEPIVDIKTWNMAQKILESRAKPNFRSDSNNPNIFSHKVYCGTCDKLAKMSKGSSKQSTSRYYRCSTKFYDKDGCEGISISYSALYNEVFSEFKKVTQKFTLANSIDACVDIKNDLNELKKQYENDINTLLAKVSKVNICVKNLYLDKISETIDTETYNVLSKDFIAEREQHKEKIEQYQNKIKELNKSINNTKDTLETVKDYLDCKEMTFEMV